MLRKTRNLTLVILTIAALIIAVSVRNAASTVAGGKHDLSTGTVESAYSFDTSETCVFCHTPHNANINQRYNMDGGTQSDTSGTLGGQWLWNRRLPGHTFQVYSSTTLNASPSNPPGNLSLLCLSCHDGVGAMNVLLNYYGAVTTLADFAGSGNQFGELGPNGTILNIGGATCTPGTDNCTAGGGDLTNDHPVGFSYDTAQSNDTGLIAFGSLPSVIQRRLNLTATHQVECSTCHDPHLTSSANPNFLVMGNNGSALCLGCHNK